MIATRIMTRCVGRHSSERECLQHRSAVQAQMQHAVSEVALRRHRLLCQPMPSAERNGLLMRSVNSAFALLLTKVTKRISTLTLRDVLASRYTASQYVVVE